MNPTPTPNSLHATLTAGTPFQVIGYRNSEGQLLDLVCRPVGREGYHTLNRQSLAALDDAFRRLLADQPELDPETARAAHGALRNSLLASLDETKEAVQGPAREALIPVTGDVFLKDGKPEQVVVLRLEVLRRIVREDVAKKSVRPSAPAVRALLTALLPCGRYLHRLNLYPGKFEAVLAHDPVTS